MEQQHLSLRVGVRSTRTDTRLRFWQEYAVELDDDAYGVYNFNWGYYLESLRLLCVEGTGKPFDEMSR